MNLVVWLFALVACASMSALAQAPIQTLSGTEFTIIGASFEDQKWIFAGPNNTSVTNPILNVTTESIVTFRIEFQNFYSDGRRYPFGLSTLSFNEGLEAASLGVSGSLATGCTDTYKFLYPNGFAALNKTDNQTIPCIIKWNVPRNAYQPGYPIIYYRCANHQNMFNRIVVTRGPTLTPTESPNHADLTNIASGSSSAHGGTIGLALVFLFIVTVAL